MFLMSLCRSGVVLSFLLAVSGALAAERPLVLLHTNDLHDHLRAGENGRGGLPYVAGYVAQVRAAEPAVLLVDAGDVTEKGDLVAFRAHGVMTYDLMRRIGYDGVALGNHDYDDIPLGRMREFEQALGGGILCLNVLGPGGGSLFTGSRVVEKDGLRIGLIGLLTPRKSEDGGLDFAASGRALAAEATRLKENCDLVVAVCHENPLKCAEWSRQAPAVDIFVSGHSHTALEKPVVADTGAIIVQAGSYARWVGRLELTVDTDKNRVVRHAGRLVPMNHAEIRPEADMLRWVREREQALAPEADDFVGDNPAEIDGFAVARIGAEALRRAAGADVGFCHPYQVIRNILPAGPVDVNAVFKTGGHRGHDNVLVDLTGTEIEAYVNALVSLQREPPEWAGFRVVARDPWRTDLAADRRYRVVMPKIEWETRFLRLVDRLKERAPANPLATGTFAPVAAPVNFTDATVAYLRQVLRDGATWSARAQQLARDREGEKSR